MATTLEDLEKLRAKNEEKRKLVADEARKASALRDLIENDQTMRALQEESKRLDNELETQKTVVKHLEEVSGVSADSLKLPVLREPLAQVTAPQEVTETTVKRGQK